MLRLTVLEGVMDVQEGSMFFQRVHFLKTVMI